MNKRLKKKRRKYDYICAKQRKRNRELCKHFPFLIPRNVWSDQIIWDMDKRIKKYSWTLVNEFPRGWWKAFGLMLCEELREELVKHNYLNKFRFEQIKEKFGQLRAYTNSLPIGCNVDDIIEKYSHLSENICISCGKPDVPMINDGWYSPYCYDCFKRNFIKRTKWRSEKDYQPPSEEEIRTAYDKVVCSEAKMADSYSFVRCGVPGKITVDISATAEAIRERARDKY